MEHRFQPYRGRRKYRSWLTDPNPTPPRSTADRMKNRQVPHDVEEIYEGNEPVMRNQDNGEPEV